MDGHETNQSSPAGEYEITAEKSGVHKYAATPFFSKV